MANVYVSSVGYNAVTAWASGVAKNVGDYVRPTAPALNAERVFKATSKSGTGTTGAAEPSWNNGAAQTTTDNAGANQIVWTEVTGKESEQASGAWHAPAARIAAVPATRIASGDTIYVSNTHAETQSAAAITVIPAASYSMICVTESTAAIPPVSADITTGATVNTTGANNITLGNGSTNAVYIEGVAFQAGSGASAAGILFSAGTVSTAVFVLKNVGLNVNNTGVTTTSSITFGGTGANPGSMRVTLINPTITFGAAQAIFFGAAHLDWRGGTVAGTSPASLFSGTSAIVAMSTILVRGADLSNVTTNLLGGTGINEWRMIIANCKIASGVTPSVNGVLNAGSAGYFRMDNCDDTSGNTNYRFAWVVAGASVVSDTTVVRTGGASDGVTALSMKVATGVAAAPTLIVPVEMPAIAKRFNTTGSAVTATVEFIANVATALTNAQIWLEIEALTSASSPISTFTDDRVADVLAAGSAQPTSTSAWDTGGVSARQNGHAYVAGDVFKVATNPNRVFFCTSPGTTAGSEPAGYASAVDGGAVTDNTATFRAGMRQKLNVTFTPQKQGVVKGTVKIGVTSTTIYVDPKMAIA